MSRNVKKWGLGQMFEINSSSAPQFYSGTYQHNLDPRNRLTIPSEWRVEGDEGTKGNFYLAFPHPQGGIAFYPPALQQMLREKVFQSKISSAQAQMLWFHLFGNAHQCSCDKQGRVLLTENLIKHANIDKECMLVGCGASFQVLSRAKHAELTQTPFNLYEAMAAADL